MSCLARAAAAPRRPVAGGPLAVMACAALMLTAGSGLLFIGGVAWAEEADLRGANQLELYYDTALEESLVDDRLDIDLTWNRFSAGVVFLSHTPSDPRLDPNKYGIRQEGIRKRWVGAKHGPVEARLGDSYATLGSGMVLMIYEDKTIDFDNVVDGAHIRAELGRFDFEGIAGTNSYGRPATIVKGLAARSDLGKGWSVVANGALVDSVFGDEPRPGRDGIAGLQGTARLPGGIDLKGEYAIRHYSPERKGRRSPADGHGGYFAANASVGRVAFLVEGKDLLRFAHAYGIPPTVVRQHTTTLLNRGSHVPNIRLDDERGIQTEVMINPSPALSFTGNWSRSYARHADLPAWEVVGEAEADWIGTHWILRAGETEEKVREGSDRVFFERITYGGDAQRSFGPWAIEVGYETQATQKQDLATSRFEWPVEYRDQVATVSLTRAPRHSWSVTTEWSDEPNLDRESWFWAEWRIRLGLLGQLTVAGGSLRGGQVCSGGVCKIVDPFEGGRLELLTNF